MPRFRIRYPDDGGDPVLADGEVLRVRFFDGRPPPDHLRVTDAHGGSAGLHRPGYRLAHGGGAADALQRDGAAADRAKAYALYDAEVRQAWRGDDAEAYAEGSEGSSCTVRNERFPLKFGSEGTIRRVDGELICVPNNPQARTDHATVMDELYQEYDDELENAWRSPR
jgi:hypothetical protein